jgi:uncharacterized SAM-binding protein YcdF (DUF218 family)
MHFYELKAMAREALLPPMGLLVLSVIGAVLLALRWRRSGWTCLGAGLSLMWALSMPIVADTLTLVVQAYPAFNPATATHAQAIVILGGAGQREPAAEYGTEPAAQLDLLDRLNYGAWLSRRTHLPILVTSDPRNAHTMAVSLTRDFQMPPRWIDAEAHDTYENARNSARMLHADHVNSILLVTSTTHMRRSVREFTATGLSVTAAPDQVLIRNAETPYEPYPLFRYMPSAEAMLRSNRAVYELLGEPVREAFVLLNLRRQERQINEAGWLPRRNESPRSASPASHR